MNDGGDVGHLKDMNRGTIIRLSRCQKKRDREKLNGTNFGNKNLR